MSERQRKSASDWDEKLGELHEQLVESVSALIEGDRWKQALEFAARFRSRSFNNTVLIWAQHAAAFERGSVPDPQPTYVAGFKQWQALGRSVIRGQRGYMIFAPLTGRFATSSPADVSSWRRLNPRERPRAGEIVRSRIVGARPAYVWDVTQTEGRTIPEQPVPTLLRGAAPPGLWDGLARLVRAEGFALSLVAGAAAIGGANGRTDFGSRNVAVREDMDAAARAKTLAHELAHIRMHGPDHEALAHRGIGEVEAESVALMIGATHGMDTRDYTIPYVSSWATSVPGKVATTVVQETGERVRRVAADVLAQLPTAQLGSGDPPGLDRSAPAADSARRALSARGDLRPAERIVSRGL